MEHTTPKPADILTREVQKAQERVRDIAESALEKGRETIKEARERGQDALENVRERGEETWEDAQKLVRKHPGKAIGIALLGGTVVGALIALRSDD